MIIATFSLRIASIGKRKSCVQMITVSLLLGDAGSRKRRLNLTEIQEFLIENYIVRYIIIFLLLLTALSLFGMKM